jgi:hypothetical protein
MLREAARQAGAEISGIGIGSTGWVHPFTGEFGYVDFLPSWKRCNPVKDLGRAFAVGVALENDGDAAVLGEAAWGAGRNKQRLIYVTVGTGIGGGIILDGQLYRGVDRSHPEVEERGAGGPTQSDRAGMPVCAMGENGAGAGVAGRECEPDWGGTRLASPVRDGERRRSYWLRIFARTPWSQHATTDVGVLNFYWARVPSPKGRAYLWRTPGTQELGQ